MHEQLVAERTPRPRWKTIYTFSSYAFFTIVWLPVSIFFVLAGDSLGDIASFTVWFPRSIAFILLPSLVPFFAWMKFFEHTHNRKTATRFAIELMLLSPFLFFFVIVLWSAYK